LVEVFALLSLEQLSRDQRVEKRMFNTTVAAPTMRTDASFGLNGREKVHPISDVANLAVQNFRDIEEVELEAIVEKVTNVAEQELNYERDVENAPLRLNKMEGRRLSPVPPRKRFLRHRETQKQSNSFEI
jgi:hypothetical protein